jgi:ABC-type transport system involved in cytochrome bd biosynthesis fused ATPase/permease subunit
VTLRGEVAAEAAALVAAGPELLMYGQHDAGLRRLDALEQRLARAETRNAHAAGVAAAIVVASSGAAVVVAAWAGVQAVTSGSLDGVLLAVVVLTPLALAEVVSTIAPAAGLTPALRASADRVQDVLDRPDPVAPIEGRQVVEPPPGPVGVLLDDVVAGWNVGGADVLSGASLRIAPGEQVAIIGASGAGKSTTALLLTRLLEPSRGIVAMVDEQDGVHNLVSMDEDAARRVIGLVEQDAYVFDSTIEQNLRLARPDADEAALVAALRGVHLDEWVAGLPDGLQTFVGEHGALLSGGQRRRLAVARVLLADHRVVVLDEPAEHLDDATADALMADVLSALAGRTLVLITHRPDHAALMDRQVRLEHGRFHDHVPALEHAGRGPSAG